MRQMLAVLLCLTLTACIGTRGSVITPNRADAGAGYWYEVVNHGGMTPQGLEVLQAQLDRRLASVRTDKMAPGALQVRITVTSYRMRHGAARALVGVMAGTDRVNSRVEIVQPETGDVLGSMTVESKNQTALGSAGGLLERHADEIADFVLGRS